MKHERPNSFRQQVYVLRHLPRLELRTTLCALNPDCDPRWITERICNYLTQFRKTEPGLAALQKSWNCTAADADKIQTALRT